MTTIDDKERLWAKLLAHPDDLTDIRIIFTEWVNTKTTLDNAPSPSPAAPPVRHAFGTWQEREDFLKVLKDAQQWRAHISALRETHDSLVEQLRMMADDLPLETLDELLLEIGGQVCTAVKPQ
jgi:hypothetical protein